MPIDSASPDFPGTQRFEIRRVLGAGGMGVVYEAFDRERAAKVALKTLRTLEAEARLRFKNEFRSLQHLQHPNLVSLGELLEENGRLYFTMELVTGVDFFQHVRPREGTPRAFDRLPPSSRGSAAIPPAIPAAIPPPPPAPNGEQEGAPPGPAALPRLKPVAKSFNEARLRSSLKQLASGIFALHSAQKVHRDIKPSNVLVTDSGRVVILDFGLITDLARSEACEGAGVVGTAHFMAPEQAAAKAVGPEADWYSFGVMLYLALTGCYPFQLSPDAAREIKQRVEPTPPGLIADGLPGDLETLCTDLLRIDPAARPAGREVLQRLGVLDEEVEEPNLLSSASAFVGRHAELGELDAAFAEARRGNTVTMLVQGESGVGKSALVRRFLDRIDQIDEDAVVLSGRCYERESMPYKAVDELVDALGRHLGRLPLDDVRDIVPANASLLGTVFPVLRRIDAFARMPRVPRSAIDPLEIRTLVFDALRELFRRLASQRPLVLAIDDFQWADVDSMALLDEVMRPNEPKGHEALRAGSSVLPSPAILLVAIIRTGSEGMERARGTTTSMLSLAQVRSIQVRSLPQEDAERLVRLLLDDAGRDPGADVAPEINAQALAREAGGHPLFIDALLRHRLVQGNEEVPSRLEEVLWSRIQRIPAQARQILELIAVSGRPLLREIAARAATVEIGDMGRQIAWLRTANLIHTTAKGQSELIEPYHDRIRQTVLSHLDEAGQRVWNERLARALEGANRVDLESLAVHWRDAGDAERAARYATLAGDQAFEALAFDRAARLYRMATELAPREGPEARPLLTKLADALANAGRGAEAAEIYLAATFAGAPPDEALELERRAAENLLRSGHVDEGMGGLNFVLAVVGLEVAETPERALHGLLLRREQLRQAGLHFEERPERDIPRDVLTRIDVCWSASLGLAMVDPIRGADFQTRNLLLSLEAGEPYRVARAIALEAAFVANSGGPVHDEVQALLDQADAAASRTGSPHALGLAVAVRGISLYLEGKWGRSVDLLDEADDIFRERCAGVPWERASVRSFALWDLWFLGDLREFSRRMPHYLREAQERGDRYFATSLRSYIANAYWLMLDDPAAATRHAGDATRRWSKAGFHLQHYFDLIARGQIDLYRGDPEGAYRYLQDRWADLDASLILNIQLSRIVVTHLRASLALALAERSDDPSPFLRDAASSAREIEAERMAWADPLAALVRAGVAFQNGDAEGAASLLGTAAHGFQTEEMALYEAAARRRLGEVQGGTQGRAMGMAANLWMEEQGIKNPDRMTAMLAPGFSDRRLRA